jgi:hypothetical protein
MAAPVCQPLVLVDAVLFSFPSKQQLWQWRRLRGGGPSCSRRCAKGALVLPSRLDDIRRAMYAVCMLSACVLYALCISEQVGIL